MIVDKDEDFSHYMWCYGGKIYKLVNETTGDVYYGSTTDTLFGRIDGHKSHHNKTRSKTMFGDETHKMHVSPVENCKHMKSSELLAREGEYIIFNECINACIPNAGNLTTKQVTNRRKLRLVMSKIRCQKEYSEDLEREAYKRYTLAKITEEGKPVHPFCKEAILAFRQLPGGPLHIPIEKLALDEQDESKES